MTEHFEARKDVPIIRVATRAFVDTLLETVLPALQLAARGCGYAITVHGSKARDIDLVAVPWTEQADSADLLLDRLVGALAGHVGRAYKMKDWVDKPHGRRATTILLPGMCPEIDLSVMPLIPKVEDAGDS